VEGGWESVEEELGWGGVGCGFADVGVEEEVWGQERGGCWVDRSVRDGFVVRFFLFCVSLVSICCLFVIFLSLLP